MERTAVRRRYTGIPRGLFSPAAETIYAKVLRWIILAEGHREILELGTFKGNTTWFLNSAAKENGGLVTTVDIDSHELIAPLPEVERIISSTDQFFQNNENAFDFIFVDAGHSYEQAKRDILNSAKFLKRGGMMAVHDTNVAIAPELEVKRALDDAILEIGGSWQHMTHGSGLSIGEF